MPISAVAKAKADLNNTVNRMLSLLDEVPEDRLYWSPSPSSRTPVQLVGHSANALDNIKRILEGGPLPDFSDIARLDASLREGDQKMTSKTDAVKWICDSRDAYLQFLDKLAEEDLTRDVPSLFGPLPMSTAIEFGTIHTAGHVAQLEYLQTIWGDRDWHF